MAKLYYSPGSGTTTVRADDDIADRHDIEITADQATALALDRVAAALRNLHDPIDSLHDPIGSIGTAIGLFYKAK